MKINRKEYITAEQVTQLKAIYANEQSDDIEEEEYIKTTFPNDQQIQQLMQQAEHMDIDKFLSDKTGWWYLEPAFDPHRSPKGTLQKIMNPSPSFISEYGEPLYKNPFNYQHLLQKGKYRIY